MSDSWTQSHPPARTNDAPGHARPETAAAPAPLGLAAQYVLSLLFVAAATLIAFVVEHLLSAPNLTLIYVVPVIVAAVAFGWGPALVAVLSGVLAFDFFFTQPYYSFRIASPSDIWAAALLLVIAGIVSSVAAQSRRRAMEAEAAATQSLALRHVAQLIIDRRPEWEVLRAAAEALATALQAPALVGLEAAGAVKAVAAAGGATLTSADEEAALGALDANIHTRGGAYPYDKSQFDFWPVARQGDQAWVIGVAFRDQPPAPERFVDIIRGYVAAAVAGAESVHG